MDLTDTSARHERAAFDGVFSRRLNKPELKPHVSRTKIHVFPSFQRLKRGKCFVFLNELKNFIALVLNPISEYPTSENHYRLQWKIKNRIVVPVVQCSGYISYCSRLLWQEESATPEVIPAVPGEAVLLWRSQWPSAPCYIASALSASS